MYQRWPETGATAAKRFERLRPTANVIEAEAFANLFALEKLAERQIVQSYNLLANALRDASAKDKLAGEVARRVIERLPARNLVMWNDYLDATNLTEEEACLMKP